MKFENILKGFFTTLIGAVMMGLALYSWYMGESTDWQAGGLGIIGFAMLWMRDQIPGWIQQFFTAIIEKFKNK